MNYALEYARQRQTFGKPITEHQAVAFMFADMALQIEAARLAVYKAAWLIDEGKYQREHATYLSVAKTLGTEAAVKISSDAIQVMGAQGYMMDHPLERHYRDARQLMIVEGTSQIHRMIISRALIEGDVSYA
jgi:alkylation response protein AidB-like acyl-CoA dehydrogenase